MVNTNELKRTSKVRLQLFDITNKKRKKRKKNNNINNNEINKNNNNNNNMTNIRVVTGQTNNIVIDPNIPCI